MARLGGARLLDVVLRLRDGAEERPAQLLRLLQPVDHLLAAERERREGVRRGREQDEAQLGRDEGDLARVRVRVRARARARVRGRVRVRARFSGPRARGSGSARATRKGGALARGWL